MVNLICGVGQAGGKILDAMAADRSLGLLGEPLAINSTLKDLQTLRNVPRSNWFGLSEQEGIIPWRVGIEEHVSGGFGKDPRRGEDILGHQHAQLTKFFQGFSGGVGKQEAAKGAGSSNEKPKQCQGETSSGAQCKNMAKKGSIHCSLHADDSEDQPQVETPDAPPRDGGHAISFAMIIAGLGGGTGCGSAAHLAQSIKAASSIDTSIMFVGVLPATMESTKEGVARGSYRQAWNTQYGLDQIQRHVDSILLIDNERLAFFKQVEALFPDFNRYVARGLLDIFAGNLLERVDASKLGEMSLPVIDTKDVISATSFGSGKSSRRPGYASMGWAADSSKSLAGYLVPGLGMRQVDYMALLEVAARKQSLQGANPEDAQKNLGVVRLPKRIATNPDQVGEAGVVERKLGDWTLLNETHYGITVGRRPLVSVNTLFTYERDQVERLNQIAALADKYDEGGVQRL